MRKLLYSTLILFVVTNISFAQNDNSFNGIEGCLGKKFSLTIHIVKDTLGETNILYSDIQSAIDSLNYFFEPICASFEICDTFYHPNVRSNEVEQDIQDQELATLYSIPNTINIYFFETLIDGDGPCGYAPLGDTVAPPFTETRDAIFILKSCVIGTTITHEMGHYFGLFHTFEADTFGLELVDGSNCATAGDLICDTPADPDGEMDVTCNLNPPLTDSNGDYYTPDACNIMSYYNSLCDEPRFTIGQYNRMLETMLKGRNYLW